MQDTCRCFLGKNNAPCFLGRSDEATQTSTFNKNRAIGCNYLVVETCWGDWKDDSCRNVRFTVPLTCMGKSFVMKPMNTLIQVFYTTRSSRISWFQISIEVSRSIESTVAPQLHGIFEHLLARRSLAIPVAQPARRFRGLGAPHDSPSSGQQMD